ncbi:MULTISPECIES: DNA primase [unclassified Fibrobacter]|uniref:DNA primase n=1 Tax=unclassified Fibrobacter TaxID=2634177 RepID=UPI000D6BFE0F|nr:MULTISPECIES: DNA primase [unclassified Fibrobacter]PWJ71887.1 DNA primase [Fibrobacter sp. UWR4]PZW73801.1 DNA primase [Fibrobacter sp. UWR1]
MAFYSNEIIQQLKSQTDIAAVIESFLPLKRSGNGRYLGVCPFHDDRSPSMNVNPSLGIYKCFACGAAGDVFKFVQEHEKMDFKGAVEWVANFSHFTLPQLGAPENAEAIEEREQVRKLNELACQWFEQQLTMSEKAMAYLNSRHITAETRQRFHIGYAPDGREGFISFAVKNGFSPADCVKAGLAVEKEHGGISDKFRDRLMIAIQNISGMIVAFGGRDLSENKDPNFKPAKYMNSPESALYHKSDILFGLHHSRQSIAKENAVIIVEGYFDMISLFQGGVTNVVAASGTALTETHASILARYAKTAYLVFDGDAAGQKATMRSLEIVLPKGIAPRVFALSRPDGTKIDPDNFVNEQGPEAFRNALTTADDWLNYLASRKDLRSPEERASFVSYAKSLVKSIADRELQNQYLKLISERFNTDRSLAQVRPIKQEKRLQQAAVPQVQEAAIQWHAIPPIEIRFANLLLRNPSLMERALEYFDMDWAASGIQMFESPIVDEFVNTVVALYAETGTHNPQVLYESVSKEMQSFIEGLPDEQWKPPQEIYEFYQTLTVLSTKLCDRQKKELPLDTMERVNARMKMTKFTQGMQTINNLLNAEKIQIDAFADQVVRSKAQLIQFQAALPDSQGFQAESPLATEPQRNFDSPQEISQPQEFGPPPEFDSAPPPEEPPEGLSEEPPEEFGEEPPDEEEYSYNADEFNNDDDMGF